MGEIIQWQRPADCYAAISQQEGFSEAFTSLVLAKAEHHAIWWQGTRCSQRHWEEVKRQERAMRDRFFKPMARDEKHLSQLMDSLAYRTGEALRERGFLAR